MAAAFAMVVVMESPGLDPVKNRRFARDTGSLAVSACCAPRTWTAKELLSAKTTQPGRFRAVLKPEA